MDGTATDILGKLPSFQPRKILVASVLPVNEKQYIMPIPEYRQFFEAIFVGAKCHNENMVLKSL